MTWSALKATISSVAEACAAAGALLGCSANAGTGRTIGSADHQTNLARNASLAPTFDDACCPRLSHLTRAATIAPNSVGRLLCQVSSSILKGARDVRPFRK